MRINLGLSDANTAKFYLTGTANDSHDITVANNGGVKVVGTLGTGGATNTFSGNITNSATSGGVLLENTTNGVANFTGVISGTGSVQIGGGATGSTAATVILGGANTFSGPLYVSAGTLSITNANSLGSGQIQLGNAGVSTVLLVNSNTTITNQFRINNAATNAAINVASGATLTISGQTTQDSTKVNTTKYGKDGAGTLVLSGTNSDYNGQLQVGQGTVIVGVNNALGTNVTTLARGVDLGLNVGDVSTTNNVSLLASNGVTVGQSVYVAPNTSSGTRTIGLSGNGTNTFNNEIYLDGNLTVSVGTSVNDRVNLSGNLINTGGIIKTGTGNAVLTGTNTYSGTTTISAGTLTVGAGGTTGQLGTGNITNNGTLAYNRSDAVTLTNVISGTGALTVTNTGALTLSATNSYSGKTTVSTGSTLILSGVNSGSGAVILGSTAGASTLRIARTNGLANGILSGVSSSTNAGTVDLTGGGNYTIGGYGNATDTGGWMIFTNSSGLATTLTFTAGTNVATTGGNGGRGMTVSSANLGLVFNGLVDISGTAAGGFTLNGPGNYTFNGGVNNTTGTRDLSLNGTGTVTIGAYSGYNGGTSISGGVLVTTGNELLLDTGTVAIGSAGTFRLGGNETVASVSASNTGANLDLQGNTLTVGGTGLTYTNSAFTYGTGGKVVKNGAGLLYLNNGTNTYTGGFTLNAGEVQFTSSGNAAAGVVTNSVFGTGTVTLAGGTISTSDSAGNSGRTIFNNVALNGTVQMGQTAWGTTNARMNSGTALLTFSTNGGGSTTLQGNSTINTLGYVLWDQAISGNFRLTKTGTGTNSLSNNYLRLTASNNIAGVTVSSGILGYKNRNALGTGTLILADGVQVMQDGALNNASPTGNDQTDRAVANALQINGNVTFGGAAFANHFGGNVDLAGANRTITLSNTTFFYGQVTNGGLVIDNGTGTGNRTLNLSASNSFSGGVVVNSNAIVGVGNDNALGTGSLVFTNTSGANTSKLQISTLSTNATQTRTITNNIGLASGINVTVDSDTTAQDSAGANASVTVNSVLSGAITGSGALTKAGTSTVTLSGANTYSGGTTISGGTLQGNTTSLQGNITNNATVTFNQTNSGSYGGVISGTGSMVISGSGAVVTMTTNNTYVGNTTVGNGATLVGTAFGYNTNTNTALTTVLGIATNTFKKTILTVDGGTVSYTGAGETNYVYFNVGTNGATFDASGTGAILWNGGSGAFVASGDTNASRTITLTGTNTSANQLGAKITNSSVNGVTKVVKTGTGAWELGSSTSDYTGGTELRQGTIIIGGSSESFGTGAFQMFDGTTLTSSGTTVRTNKNNNNFQLGGSLTLSWLEFSNTTLTNNTTISIVGTNSTSGSAVTFAGSGIGETNGSRSLTLNAGAGTNGYVTFSGSNTFSGGLTLGNGLNIRVTNNGTLGATNGAVTVGNSTIDLGGRSLTNGVFTLNTGTLTNGTLSASSVALTNAGTINAILAGSGSLTKTGTGTSVLSGANTYSGGTLISAGTLQGDTTSLQGRITNNATASFNQAGNGTYSGAMSGTGALTLDGAGIVTLSGSNSYSGRTTLNAGTLLLGSTNALGTGGTDMTVGTWLTGGVLDLGGLSLTGETLVMNSQNSYITNSSTTTAVLGGTMHLTNSTANTFAVALGKDINFTGSITNGSASRVLVKNGAGTLTMSGSNTNNGVINVNGGTLRIGNTNALGNATTTSNIAVAAGATLDLNGFSVASLRTITNAGGTLANSAAGAVTFGNAITMAADSTYNAVGDMTLSGTVSGGFRLTKTGAGMLTLSSGNSYSGGTTLNEGTLGLGSSTALGTGTVTLNGGTIGSITSARTLANNFILGGDVTFGTGDQSTTFNGNFDLGGVVRTLTLGNSATFNGNMTNGGLVFNAGSGGVRNITLGASNSFAGGLTVNGGNTVRYTNGNSLGTGLVRLSGNSILRATNSTTTANDITITAGQTGYVEAVAGTTNTLSGTLTKNGSVLVLGGGGTHIVNGGIVGADANSDLVISNATATINSTNSYNGPTFVVAGGTLLNGADNALPTDTVLTLGQSGETSSLVNTYDLSGKNQTVARVASAGSGVNVITNSSGSANLTLNSAVNHTISGLRVGGSNFTLTKAGANTVTLGTGNNFSQISTIAITGGTLLLGQANQISDSTAVTLGGGTLSTGGFADRAGKLTVSAGSAISGLVATTGGAASANDFLFSSVDLTSYATSSGASLNLGGGYGYRATINIANSDFTGWSGYSTTSINNFADKVMFGSTGMKAQINFNGSTGLTYITAIPEPKVYVAMAMLVALVGVAEYKRRKKAIKV